MRKIRIVTLGVITMVLSGFLFVSCSKDEDKLTETVSEIEKAKIETLSKNGSKGLVDKLKNDEDFIRLVNLTDLVLEMPDKESFIFTNN